MQIHSIKTHKIEHGDSLDHVLDQYVSDLRENTILAITSKIISVIEGRFVQKEGKDKYSLIRQEADKILKTAGNPYHLYLTLKNGMLIPSAGIDESNGNGVYILYPKDIQGTAVAIWHHLKQKHKLQNIGVVITDSHTTMMRRGVTGVALGWCGFEPLYSYVGRPDLYAQPLKVTQINIVDSLAVAAVFAMGEGGECTPMAVIQNPPHMNYLSHPPSREDLKKISIDMDKDLYAPLLMAGEWE